MALLSEKVTALVVGLSLMASACGGGSASSTGTTTSSATDSTGSTGSTGGTTTGNTASTIDPHKLPVGTAYVTTSTPAPGSLYMCGVGAAGGPGAHVQGPWFSADGKTWDPSLKISVQGAVSWVSSFTVKLGNLLQLNGNGLPNHTTGTFPIATSDPAYAYDRNPNQIKEVDIAWGLSATPQVNSKPTCLGMGAIGVLVSGVRLFAPVDESGRDAVAWETQDACEGHPQENGAYHYHSVSSCVSKNDVVGKHSPLLGYIADGFGLYGNQGENGKALTNADLDICHGHTHAINVNGVDVAQYHYHQTKEFPYAVGCYKGTPMTIH